MPGAEVAGLVIGTIALATLFSTCIELFDYFELGRNYVYDYDLACTKLALLRERLRDWGSAMRVAEPGAEDSQLRTQWSMKAELVGKSLLGLRQILCNSEILMQKYELRRASDVSPSLRRRTAWAIHDKGKFDRLIQDISFLVENLEKVSEGRRQAPLATVSVLRYQLEGERMDDLEQSSHRTAVAENSTAAGSCASHLIQYQLFADNSAPESNSQDYESQTRWNPPPSRNREHIIRGTQDNRNSSIGIQGFLGNTGDSYRIEGIQVNSHVSVGIQGGASAEAVASLYDRACARGVAYYNRR